jgi:NADH-quinone oxidoreductase subunit N
MTTFGLGDWYALAPLLIVAGTGLLVLLADLIAPAQLRRGLAIALASAGLLAAACLAGRQGDHQFSAFGSAFIGGGFTIVFEEIVVLASLFTLFMSYKLGRDDQGAPSVALLLWSASGAMLMAGAGDLMTIFLGLELLSLSLYCLCAFAHRSSAREAALKYLVLSSTASGFMLYGMALLFGAVGDVALSALSAGSGPLFTLGLALFFIGLAFKLSLVPFHIWTPDVYEGAPLPVTAFMSIVTKAGTLAVFARFIYAVLPKAEAEVLALPLWVLAAFSMILGNVAALAQTDMKRLLAYSGIAQLGYVVAALAGATADGLRSALFYLTAYAFMNLGAFAVTALLSRSNDEGSRMVSFVGLGYRRPLLAAAMTFFLLGLAGLPPTAGFTGKILILASAVQAGYSWLAGLLVIGTAISLYAYLKIVRMMYTPITERAPTARPTDSLVPLPWVGVVVCAAAVLAMGLYPVFPSALLPLAK